MNGSLITTIFRPTHQETQSECSVLSNFLLCSLAQQPPVFISYYIKSYKWQPSFLPLAHALLHTFIYESDCTPLQCFYKGCIQSNQQLALSRLMHRIYYGSAVFPYQALESTAAQETLIGLHNIQISKAMRIHHIHSDVEHFQKVSITVYKP
jgi:hypothetical protein